MGNRDADGLVYPLFLREQEAGWRAFKDEVVDDDEDGHKEVNRSDEIIAGLKAFAATLEGNNRFEQVRPVFIKTETAYELDESGNLIESSLEGTPLEGASHVKFTINHNTAPTRMALGVNGCEDCHVSSAHMFKGQQTVALHGRDGTPEMISNGRFFGCNLNLWQHLLFGSATNLHNFHVWAGVVFIITTVGGVLLWFRDAAFESYDKDWVRKMGGYLGHKGEVPAGRFNAGQKMFYWYSGILGVLMSITGLALIFKDAFSLPTICIMSTFHNLLGFFLIAGVLAHAYLGTIANPGTWRVLIDGSVTREWAEHHHPNWFRALLTEERHAPPSEAADKDSEDAKTGDSTA